MAKPTWAAVTFLTLGVGVAGISLARADSPIDRVTKKRPACPSHPRPVAKDRCAAEERKEWKHDEKRRPHEQERRWAEARHEREEARRDRHRECEEAQHERERQWKEARRDREEARHQQEREWKEARREREEAGRERERREHEREHQRKEERHQLAGVLDRVMHK